MARADGGYIKTLRERIQIEAGQLPIDETEQDHPDDGYDAELSTADAEALIEFSDQLYLLSSEYSNPRHTKLLRHLTLLAERVGGVADALDDRDAAEELVRHINREYQNEETNKDYRIALRVYGKHLAGENGDPPASLEWIPSSTSSTYDPAPDPGEMLEWETEVQEMIDATNSEKEAAAIALQFDAGLRGGEFKDLTTDQFTDHRFGLQVTVHGKQGQRTVTLIPSVPYVRKWLESHPGGSGAPMWCKRTDATRRVSDRTIYNWFEKAADRADVDKPVTLTNFRKSSASFMASRGMNQAHLEQRYGWVRGSKTASRYVSVFAEESELETARVWGKEIEEGDEPEPLDPVECPRCDKETPRDRDLCVWCGQALEAGAAEVADELENWLVERISEAESDGEKSALMETWEEVRNDPEARAEAVDRLAEVLGREPA